jgi:outer membrane protein OmpA-like peptidoglycan-associated protein
MPLYTYLLAFLLWLCFGLSETRAQDLRSSQGSGEQAYPQFAPVLSPDGSLFLYSEVGNTANFGRENLADIWICHYLGENQWSRPLHAGMPLNSERSDQCLAITLDKNELFLLLEDEVGQKSIGYSRLSFRTWSSPQAMRIEPWDSSFQIQHGFISNDGQTLLLCIERSDSLQRKTDIYVAQREGDLQWKNLQNLGPAINTSGREHTAFLAADGQTLYFASDGHRGLGGLDLFMSRRSSASWTDWSPPLNLGSTFNTRQDEWGFYSSVKGEMAWWTQFDGKIPRIISANLPSAFRSQPVILVSGQVLLPQSKKPAPKVTVSLNYFDPQRNTRVQVQGLSNAQGKYQLLLPRNAEMTINALYEQFFSPTYNLLRKGPAASESEDSDELMGQILSSNPAYRQVEEEIERLQLAYNQQDILIKNLNKERQNYVYSILEHWGDTLSLSLGKTSSEAIQLKKLREDYLAAQKQQALLQYHDAGVESKTPDGLIAAPIPTDFNDFFRVIEAQQRLEILPNTAQSLILQMLNEEIKKKDKEIKPSERAIWRTQKDAILSTPSLLLLPEADLAKWRGVFSPCFEWQEVSSRDIANFLLQKNQAELTTLIKNEVRNYLRTILDMRVLVAQSLDIRQQIRDKVEDQLRVERNDQQRPFSRLNSESAFTMDTLMVIAGNELEQDIQLFDPIVEKTITLENLVFLPNQAELDSSAYPEVRRLASFLLNNPKLDIEIVAHTNNRCTYNFATELTSRRAEKLAELLVQQQVPIERIRHRGMGKEQPMASNALPAGRLANQRIEITFIQP